MAMCPKCGINNFEGAKFCSNCATPLIAGVTPAQDMDENDIMNRRIRRARLVVIAVFIVAIIVLLAPVVLSIMSEFTGGPSNNNGQKNGPNNGPGYNNPGNGSNSNPPTNTTYVGWS